ncbi:MAG TPA: peroxiredoxin [Thermoanaerobaculia bacterium]|nr:peroxiredoxin [Thermoanaerobaculia bacterium]
MKTLLRSLAPVLLVALFAVFSRSAAAAPPAVGSAAPAVSLQSQEGKTITLDQNKGKWVVLYFYPKDFTSGCTTEAHNFQRDQALYEKLGAVVLGVSFDTVDSHKGFCAKEGLNFKLLADTTGAVSKEYDSVMTMGDKTLSARNTFLIDPTGVIRKVYLKVNPATHSADVLADLATLQAKK